MKIKKKDLSHLIEKFLFEEKVEELSDEEEQLKNNIELIGSQPKQAEVYAAWKSWSEKNREVKHHIPEAVLSYFKKIGYDLAAQAGLTKDTKGKTSLKDLTDAGHIAKFSNAYKVYIDKLDETNN